MKTYSYTMVDIVDGWVDMEKLYSLGADGWKVVMTTQWYILMEKEYSGA